MEVHGPQSPIHSLRDFATHIATVTIGILIALGLEAVVEAHRNHELVAHTRADFHTEFADNRTAVQKDIKHATALKAELEGLIAYGQAKLAGGPSPALPVLPSARSFVFVNTTAWPTALGAQAMIHFPIEEAGVIAQAERKQEAFNELQSRAEAEWFELAAYGDPRSIPTDEIRPALQKVTVAYAYLATIIDTENTLVAVYDKALQSGRKPR